MKTCCFTGHRTIPQSPILVAALEQEIINLIQNGVTDFYAGGALGWDTLCAETVLHLRDTEFPHIRLHLILPCPEADQTAKWNDIQKHRFQEIQKTADSTEVLSDSYTKTCMKQRNQQLVKLSDCCICYYNEKRSASGTGQTVRMAQKKQIPIKNLWSSVPHQPQSQV